MNPSPLAVDAVLSALILVLAIGLVAVSRRVRGLRREIAQMTRRVERLEFGESTSDPNPVRYSKTHARVRRTDLSPGLYQLESSDDLEPKLVSDVVRDTHEPLSTDRAMAAFNALAAQFSQSALDAFAQRWRPEPMARAAEDRLIGDAKGEFWLIRTPASGEPRGLVVPGPEIVRKWELYYRSMGSLAAKNLLDSIYEVGEGAPLRLERPAVAIETGHGWKVHSLGKFADN